MRKLKNRKYETFVYDFYKGLNIEYLTDVFRQYCKDEFKNHTPSIGDALGVNKRTVYYIVIGRHDISLFSYSEFKKVLKAIGYKIQHKITPI